MRLTAWFDAQGTELPLVPASAGGLDLVGGRYCRLLDRTVAHVYYGGGEQQLSLFVIPGPVRFDRSFVWTGAGTTVNLLRVAGSERRPGEHRRRRPRRVPPLAGADDRRGRAAGDNAAGGLVESSFFSPVGL